MTPGGRGAAAQGGEICVRTPRAPDTYWHKYKYVRKQIQNNTYQLQTNTSKALLTAQKQVQRTYLLPTLKSNIGIQSLRWGQHKSPPCTDSMYKSQEETRIFLGTWK